MPDAILGEGELSVPLSLEISDPKETGAGCVGAGVGTEQEI